MTSVRRPWSARQTLGTTLDESYSGEGTSDRESHELFTGLEMETILAAFAGPIEFQKGLTRHRSIRVREATEVSEVRSLGHVTGKKTPLNQCSV